MPFQRNHSPKIIIIVGFIAAILILFIAAGWKNIHNSEQSTARTLSHMTEPTPAPFEDMTIPYLRNREYKSTLGSREVAYESANYTAYLTNYTSDGLRVNGLLTIPHGQTPQKGWPAIVFVHGYIPPATYETNGQAYSSYVDYLARSGFVVFKIDLRGHGNSEGEAGGGYFGSDYVVDTLNAYSALQSSSFVNSRAIGLWGHSMAGNIITRSMAVRPDIPAGVIWAGAVYSYTDMQKYGIQDSSYSPSHLSGRMNRRRELFEKVGSPSAESPFWRTVAPIYYLHDLKGAIQIHHAQDDSVVNMGYSEELAHDLDRANVPHEFFKYRSGGHDIEGESFSLAMQRTVDFFHTHLNN